MHAASCSNNLSDRLKASRSLHKTSNPDVGCVRYVRTRVLLFRRPHPQQEQAAMAFNKIARKDSDFYVICTLPDFCWAPPPAPPVTPPIPFPLFADLGNAKTVAKDVRLNRKPAFVFKASKTNRTTGDEPALPGRS